ncbi:MAG TPA: tetratricopeptide repeat protein [Candidatus Limnocylindrales bacterium]|nr:tetratricopeptide repeat protein [Candidatus Limnocylindrales bacterium]
MDATSAQSLLETAEQAGPGLRGLNANALFADLERQYDDLLAALQWFLENERTDEALRLAIALAPVWMARKRLDEGLEWFDKALAAPGGSEIARGNAYFQAGLLAFWPGKDERSSELHGKALAIGRQTGDPTVTALALTGLARLALRSGNAADIKEARWLCREALEVTEGTADTIGRGNAMHVLGVAAQMAGDFAEARDMMNQRIALARETGNLATVSSEAGNLSMVERQLGNLDEADALAREALEIDYRRGDEWAMPYKVSGIAAVATDRGDFERAATLVGAAEAMMEREKADWPPDERPHYERMLYRLPRGLGQEEFERIRATGRAMSTDEAVAFALGALPGAAPA